MPASSPSSPLRHQRPGGGAVAGRVVGQVDLAGADYRRQREEIDRQILAIAPVAAPVAITGIRRPAELLQDMGSLWLHPGVNPERRKGFTDEVFEEIQFDEKGIRAVLPSDEYRPLVVVAEADWGEMVGATGFEPATS